MKTKDEIKDIITTWGEALPYKARIYLYGSYAKGNMKETSDIDIALEFCDDHLPEEPDILWIYNREPWQKYLSDDDFDRLVCSLQQQGLHEPAGCLHELLHETAWTTGSELLGELGLKIREIKKRFKKEMGQETMQLIKECLKKCRGGNRWK